MESAKSLLTGPTQANGPVSSIQSDDHEHLSNGSQKERKWRLKAQNFLSDACSFFQNVSYVNIQIYFSKDLSKSPNPIILLSSPNTLSS
jgi:hypothetical protein